MSKIGIIGYYNKSGLGNIVKNFRKNLDIECQFVIKHPIKGVDENIPGEVAYGDLEPTIEQFEEFLNFNPTTVIAIETPFNWEFLPLMKQRNIRVVYIPMIDCVRFNEMKHKECVDSWIMINRLGFAMAQQNRLSAEYLPYPIDTEYFEFKERTGKVFLHNAGYYELVKGQIDAHKGTDLVIEAFKHLPELTLAMNAITDVPINIPNIILQVNEYEESKSLYTVGDIYVAPSRWEGLGLPLYEAMACGMPLITTDAPPMNDLPIDSQFRVSCVPFQVPHGTGIAYQVDMEDLVKKIHKASERDLTRVSYRNREIIEQRFSWKVLKKKYERIVYSRK